MIFPLAMMLSACQTKATGDSSGSNGGEDSCASGDCSDDTSGDSNGGDNGAGNGGDNGADTSVTYNGTFPKNRFPAPTFSVLNQDGETRTQADLDGHPTVMWFYPAAGTAG